MVKKFQIVAARLLVVGVFVGTIGPQMLGYFWGG